MLTLTTPLRSSQILIPHCGNLLIMKEKSRNFPLRG